MVFKKLQTTIFNGVHLLHTEWLKYARFVNMVFDIS